MERRRPLSESPPIVLRLRSCVSRILFLTRDELAQRATISLGSALLRTSSDLPAGTLSRRNQRSPHIWSCCRWGLPCHACHHARGALLPHHFTLADPRSKLHGRWRYLSVALSVGLRRLDVIQHRVLCSSDFPHPDKTSTGTRPPCDGRNLGCIIRTPVDDGTFRP